MRTRWRILGVLAVACAGLSPGGGASDARVEQANAASAQPTFVCSLRPGQRLLPASARRGLIHHLQPYPAVVLATADQRRAAATFLEASRRAVRRWPTLRAAQAASYVTRTAVSRDRGPVTYFHAERGDRRGTRLLDPRDPKALIYANVPGRPLTIIGVMFSVKRGERGPSPGGPVTRWHSHLVCAPGADRGWKPRTDGSCPPGTRLQQGSEMMHVWFTSDLRSAFAIGAPEPELCRDGLLPTGYCRTLDGKRRGM